MLFLTSFVRSLGEGTRPTRGHTKSASISAGHRSSSGVPSSDHSLLDTQPRNVHNSLLATADPLRQRYRSPLSLSIIIKIFFIIFFLFLLNRYYLRYIYPRKFISDPFYYSATNSLWVLSDFFSPPPGSNSNDRLLDWLKGFDRLTHST